MSTVEADIMLLLAGFRLGNARPTKIKVPAWMAHKLRQERGLEPGQPLLVDEGKVEVIGNGAT